MNIKALFTKDRGKETAVAAGKASIPAAITTALLSGASVYLGIDIDIDSLVSIFFGAGIGNLVGQFQRSPADVLRRLKLIVQPELSKSRGSKKRTKQ